MGGGRGEERLRKAFGGKEESGALDMMSAAPLVHPLAMWPASILGEDMS